MGKSIFKSKTFYVNVIGLLQIFFGPEIISADIQAGILAFANLVLRLVTKEPIKWS